MKNFLAFLGRVFLSALFILSSIYKVIHWKQSSQNLSNVLCDWNVFLHESSPLHTLFTQLMPWVTGLLILSVVIEFIGGVLVLFGMKARFGALLLILFLLPTTILFHHFWFLDGVRRDVQFALFLKNIAIIGGLLYILAFGAKASTKKGHSFESSNLNHE